MDENERTPTGNNILAINNQNLEEDEEEEDRRRREEEIHNLLSHAMGDYNFDEHSTLNSSVASKEADDIFAGDGQTNFDQQYRQSNVDDQLKLLYEVRVREVLALNREVEKLTAEFNKQEQALTTKASLLQIEVERKNISLKEAQDLLVDKTERIHILKGQVESRETAIKDLEANISQLNQDILILREVNMKLEQQLSLMERGFPLSQQIMDKELQESQRNKINQLENSLENIIEQNERKDRQQKELVRELKQNLQEKDDSLAEKCSLINKLSENFDTAQERCQELLKTVEELRQTQKPTSSPVRPLEEELRKIREYNERTDVLCENVRKVVSEEFQGQIAGLNSENRMLKDSLFKQENELQKLNQQLQVISSLEIERDNLEGILKEFQNKFEDANLARNSVTKKLADYKKERESLKEMCKQLTKDNELLRTVQAANENLQQQIVDLQMYINEIMNPKTVERSIQASFSLGSSTEIENLFKEKEDISNKLLSTHEIVDKLENKIQSLLEENTQLKERESLIKKLQDKAAQFEKIIFEKQKKYTEVKTVSTGTNTEVNQDNSVLKVKYDALLYQSETNIRIKLKQEFDTKLEKLTQEVQQKIKSHVCENCNDLRNESKKLQELRKQDRQSVVKLVDNWTEKFNLVEKESQENMTKLKAVYDQQLVSHAVKLEQEYLDKFKKISEHLKQTKQEVEHQKDKLVHTSLRRHDLMNERLNRIVTKIQQGSEEIAAIELQCLKKTVDYGRKNYVP